MKNYGITRSMIKPPEKDIDEYSVWIASDIKEITEEGHEGQPGFTGYKYNLTRYDKDEYIKTLSEQMESAQEALDYLIMNNSSDTV